MGADRRAAALQNMHRIDVKHCSVPSQTLEVSDVSGTNPGEDTV